jgi:hypothetical protein
VESKQDAGTKKTGPLHLSPSAPSARKKSNDPLLKTKKEEQSLSAAAQSPSGTEHDNHGNRIRNMRKSSILLSNKSMSSLQSSVSDAEDETSKPTSNASIHPAFSSHVKKTSEITADNSNNVTEQSSALRIRNMRRSSLFSKKNEGGDMPSSGKMFTEGSDKDEDDESSEASSSDN